MHKSKDSRLRSRLLIQVDLELADLPNFLPSHAQHVTWWTFRISPEGGGQGEPEAPGRGAAGFALKIPGGGGVSHTRRGRGPRGREGICGDFEEGGAKYFFSGPKFPPR